MIDDVAELQNQKAISKSESNLLMESGDYDDVPEEAMPNLPPKLRPNLPPKQKINKSQDDLARIEQKFKSSLAELRIADQELGERIFSYLFV